MANNGKTQLLITWVASPDKVSEMDRLVESHGSFMAKTHDPDVMFGDDRAAAPTGRLGQRVCEARSAMS